MSTLLNRLGKRVSPRFATKMREIGEANLKALAPFWAEPGLLIGFSK